MLRPLKKKKTAGLSRRFYVSVEESGLETVVEASTVQPG